MALLSAAYESYPTYFLQGYLHKSEKLLDLSVYFDITEQSIAFYAFIKY